MNTHLELLVKLRGERDNLTRYLDDVNISSRKPGLLKLPQKRFLGNERANTGRETEHFVERDRHRVDWVVG
jgi:hypothetical protein